MSGTQTTSLRECEEFEAEWAKKQVIDRIVATSVLLESIEGIKNKLRRQMVEKLQTCHWDDIGWALDMFVKEVRIQRIKIGQVEQRIKEIQK